MRRRDGVLATFIFHFVLWAIVLAGCGGPMYVKCSGKGTVTGSAMIYGGTIMADCGDAFTFEKRSYAPPTEKSGP
ncbi:MAG TPA: hypothetical protein VGR44_12080 [Methylomirabilota bacterium]|jgi:hypothetical protein|nr:hypothetical protein [Methylomirabilota bacterium]